MHRIETALKRMDNSNADGVQTAMLRRAGNNAPHPAVAQLLAAHQANRQENQTKRRQVRRPKPYTFKRR